MRVTHSFAAGALLALASTSVVAGGSVGDMFSYSGFGTAGVVRTDTDKAEYVQTGQFAGAKDSLYFKTDTKLGLQATVTPAQWLSGTVQVLAVDRINNSLSPKVEWAYIKLKPLTGFSVRVGQMALPSFLVSDSRFVGYANTWIRPPDEVYGQAVFDTFTGADVAYRHNLGPFTVTVGGLAGKSKADVLVSSNVFGVNGRNVRGYSASLDTDLVMFRFSHVKVDVDYIASGYILAKYFYTFSSIAAVVDRDNVVLQTEFIARHVGFTAADLNSWYLLGGYRMGKWLPYAIYAATQQPSGPNFAYPYQGGPWIPTLSKHTDSLGLRADLIKSVDFKLQIDHETTLQDGNPFINVQPGFSHSAFVYSFAVDFVF